MIKVTAPTLLVPPELTMALSPEATDQVLGDVMASARAFWITMAGRKLGPGAADYIDAIQEVEQAPGVASITLLGDRAVQMEQGQESYDMRDTLLGPQVPVAQPGQRGKRVNAKGGFYRAIPFRHQTPGTSGVAAAPMGSAYGPPGAALGKSIHKAAKALTATTSQPGGGTKWGGRLPAGVGGVGLLKPHHKTDIYAGMVRQEKTYRGATQNTYMTFRTISTSVKTGWIHPPVPGANLADAVMKHVEDLMPKAFLAAVEGAVQP